MNTRRVSSGTIDGRRWRVWMWLRANVRAARLFAALALLAGVAHGASIVLWYANGSTLGGSGTWNTTNSDWSTNGSAFEPWSNMANNTAEFLGSAGTVGLATPITAGGLNFQSTGFTLTGGNTLTVAANGELTLAPGTTTNIDTPLVTNAGVTLQGTGTLNINGSLGGSLTLSGNGLTSSNTPVLNLVSDPAGGSALNINTSGGSGTFGGTITGAGSLTKSGSTSVTLSGTNTFTGATTITGGQLALGTQLALENSTVNINVNNGLNLNGLASAEIGALAGTGSLNLGGTQLYLGQFGNNSSTTYSGTLSGTGSLLKYGTGTLTLSGGGTMDSLNVTSGGVNVTGGTLTLTDPTAAIDVASGALTISGGATVNATAPAVYVEAYGAGATVTVTGAGTTLNGLGTYFQSDDGGSIAVSNGAAVNSHFAGAGYDYSGTMNISSGGAVTDNLGNLGAFGTGTATVAGTGSIWANQTLDLGGDSRLDLSLGTGTLNINSGGSVTVAGATTLWTSGSSISINSGTLTTGSLVGTTGSTINLTADPVGGSALTINGTSGSAEFDGTIAGAGSLVKSGNSIETLGGSNTFSGSTTINGGQLVLANGLALQNSTVIINTANGLNLNGFASAEIGALAGTGALNLGGTALYLGQFGNNASTMYSGTFSGTGSLYKYGTGTLTLSGGGTMDSLNVTSGGVNVTGGTLTLTDTNTAINVTGGALTISGGATVNANVTHTIVQAYGAGATINVANAGTTLNMLGLLNADYGGTLAVSNGAVVNTTYTEIGLNTTATLNISSGGAVNDSESAIYSGTATVSGQGSLWANQSLVIYGSPGYPAALNVSSGGSVTVADFTGLAYGGYGPGSININGGTLTTGSLFGAGTINLTADPAIGSALTVNAASGSEEFDGTITGAGSLVKSGGSSQTLGGADTFTGNATINGGQLVLGVANALQDSTVIINTANGLNLNGFGAVTIGGLGGTAAENLGATALTVGGATTTTYSGFLSGTTGGLTYAGTGALTLSGGGSIDNLNVSSGGVNITGGTLTLTDAYQGIQVTSGALTISGGAVNSTYTILGYGGSGTLNVSSGGVVSDYVGILAAGTAGIGTATVTGTGSLWANQILSLGGYSGPGGTGTLNINNGGSVTALGTTLWTSGSSININGGTLTTGQLTGTTGTIDLQANPAGGSALVLTGFGTATFAGTITGAGGISVTGGSQILTGLNTYTGQTLVSGTTLTQMGGSNNSQITAGNGGVFYALNTTLSPLNGFGAITTQSGGQVMYDGTTVNGGFLEGAGHSIVNGGATFTGTTIDGNAVVAQNAAATFNNVTNNGTINNNATLTWNGGTIGSGGVLNVNNTVNAAGLVTNGVINIFDGDTLSNTGSNLALGAGSRTYVGSVANPGGTLSETGGTIQLNGGLLVNNGTVDGTLDVNNGGLAEGSGTYGAVDVTAGGVFHPGNSPGTAYSTSATLGDGGALDFGIDNATGTEGTDWSLWDVSGNVNITAGTTPNSQFNIFVDSLINGDDAGPLGNFDPTKSYSWTIIESADLEGFSANEFALNIAGFDNSLDGGTFSLVSNGQDLALDFTAAAASSSAPEPGTWFLFGIGLALLPAMRRGQTGVVGRRFTSRASPSSTRWTAGSWAGTHDPFHDQRRGDLDARGERDDGNSF